MSKKTELLMPKVFNDNFMHELLATFEDPNPKTNKTETHTPVDIVQMPSGYLLRMDIPGVELENIDLILEKDVLTISGRRERNHFGIGSEYRITERFHGEFKRSFSLSKNVDQDAINATLKDGILEINMPFKNVEQKSSGNPGALLN